MRVVLTGGGTGGHVYPALSLAAALERATPGVDLLYLGTRAGSEQRLVTQRGIAFKAVRAGQIRGKSPWRVAISLGRLARGVAEARRALIAFRPDAVFATGGYASIPTVLAARMLGIPLTVFLPDVYPGWSVRLAVRVATTVATSTDGALAYLPRSKTVVTGYPVRPDFWRIDKEAARRLLGLGSGPILMVSGASLGSRTLNDAVIAQITDLLDGCEVLHLTGRAEEARVAAVRDRLPEECRAHYHVAGYMEEMAQAMAAADLAVMRAGASCLAEPPAVGLPAILVPGRFSDQRRNAEFMAARGAAVVLDERELATLSKRVRVLLDDPPRLQAMAAAAREIGRPDAANDLARLILGQPLSRPAMEARVP